MSSIMHNYFYGKAGQADYTVEQMPTNRKQLFFTTLKVRFSSMVGVNLLYLVFMLPLLIWLFLGYQTLAVYLPLDGDGTDEYAIRLEEVEPGLVQEYREYYALNQQISRLIEKYGSSDAVTAAFETASAVSSEDKDVDGNPIEEHKYTKEQWETMKSDMVSHFNAYDLALTQARNGNITTTLLIAIPLFIIASLGRPGMMYVLRNWARDDHSFVWQDFKEAIKGNWKQALPLGLINGLSFFLFYIAWVTYGELASGTSWAFSIAQGLMLVLLIVWWMMNEVVYTMMVTYEMKFSVLIKNSVLMVIARLPIAFLILLGTVAVPVILSFIPMPYGFLVMFLFYALIGFALTGFVQASFSNYCFDKYLNPRIAGAEVNKGIYTPDEDEEEAAKQDLPDVPVKEDRYWEHKTK